MTQGGRLWCIITDINMKIWIDADACPRVIKDIVFRASLRLEVPVCLVANQDMSKSHSPLITSVMVEGGFDVADDHIAQHAAAGDIVITADIPLAFRIIAKGAVGIDPRGDIYTEDNVGDRLSMRNLMQELRMGGPSRGGPAHLGRRSTRVFASALYCW